MCDEIIYAMDIVSTNVINTNTIPTNVAQILNQQMSQVLVKNFIKR